MELGFGRGERRETNRWSPIWCVTSTGLDGWWGTSCQAAQIQLTRHEKRTFVAQTVHLAGNAYVDCTFDSCTLVLTNSPFVFSGKCLVQRCNWRIEFDLLWGAPAMRAQLRQVLDSMDSIAEPPPTA